MNERKQVGKTEYVSDKQAKRFKIGFSRKNLCTLRTVFGTFRSFTVTRNSVLCFYGQ